MAISDGEQAIIEAIRELKEAFEASDSRRDAERRAERDSRNRETGADADTSPTRSGIAETREGVASLNQAFRDLGSQFVSSSDIASNQLTATFGKLVDGVRDTNKAILSDSTNLLSELSRNSSVPGVEQMNNFTELIQFAMNDQAAAMAFAYENLDEIKQFGVEMIGKVVGILDEALENFFAELRNKFILGLKNLVIDVYDFERGLERTLGITEEFSRTATESFDNVRKFIGKEGLEQVNKSYSALFRTFTDFSFATELQKQRLTEVGAVLDTLGYSVENFAKGTHTLTKALGISEDAAAQTQLGLTALAMDIGVTAEQMASDFTGATDTVAKLGSQGEVAFRRLAIAAKVTGIEVGRLVQITDKFDTFDGAAEQAGKLNAALGGNFVNAMDLMTATDPVERFNMIRDSIKNAGLSFDTMSYYQKNFYKESLGLNDVGELANMLSGNMDSLNNQLGKTSAEYEEMAKRAARTQKIQDLLNTVFYNFLEIIEPAVDYVKELANSFTKDMIPNLQKTKQVVAGLLAIIGALATTIAALASVAAWALTPFTGGLTAPVAAFFSTVAASAGLATTGIAGFGMATIFGASSAEGLGIIFDALKEAFDEIIKSFSATLSLAALFGDTMSSNSVSIAKFIAGTIRFFIPFFKSIARMIDILIVVGSVVGVVVGAFMSLMSAIALTFGGFVPFIMGMTLFGHGIQIIKDKVGEVVGVFLEFITAGAALGTVIGALAGPLFWVGTLVGAVAGFFVALFDLIFDTPFNPPSAFQGLIQFADTFLAIGTNMLSLKSPISIISNALEVLFTSLFSSFGILRDTFSLLLELATTDLSMVSDTFSTIADAADRIDRVSLDKIQEFTSAPAIQQVDSGAKQAAAGNERPLQIHVRIDLDGGKFADKVINITSREIERLRRDG